MPDKDRLYKSINVRFIIIYFAILLTLQAIGILFFLRYPTVTNVFIVGLSLGLLLPIALGYLMILVFKNRHKRDVYE